MDSNEKPVDYKLREILGYLHTLGINIQKRTQYLLDNKVNENYLKDAKHLEKVAEKVNTICNLSVASLNKVNNGVRITVKNEKIKVKSSKAVKPEEENSKLIKDISIEAEERKLERNKLANSNISLSGGKADISLSVCKKRKIEVNNCVVYLPENIRLKNYTQCCVKMSQNDVIAVEEFLKAENMASCMKTDDSLGNDASDVVSTKSKNKFRIESRPTHSQVTKEKVESGENTFCGSVDAVKNKVDTANDSTQSQRDFSKKKDKSKSFKRIIRSDSSSDESSHFVPKSSLSSNEEKRKTKDEDIMDDGKCGRMEIENKNNFDGLSNQRQEFDVCQTDSNSDEKCVMKEKFKSSDSGLRTSLNCERTSENNDNAKESSREPNKNYDKECRKMKSKGNKYNKSADEIKISDNATRTTDHSKSVQETDSAINREKVIANSSDLDSPENEIISGEESNVLEFECKNHRFADSSEPKSKISEKRKPFEKDKKHMSKDKDSSIDARKSLSTVDIIEKPTKDENDKKIEEKSCDDEENTKTVDKTKKSRDENVDNKIEENSSEVEKNTGNISKTTESNSDKKFENFLFDMENSETDTMSKPCNFFSESNMLPIESDFNIPDGNESIGILENDLASSENLLLSHSDDVPQLDENSILLANGMIEEFLGSECSNSKSNAIASREDKAKKSSDIDDETNLSLKDISEGCSATLDDMCNESGLLDQQDKLDPGGNCSVKDDNGPSSPILPTNRKKCELLSESELKLRSGDKYAGEDDEDSPIYNAIEEVCDVRVTPNGEKPLGDDDDGVEPLSDKVDDPLNNGVDDPLTTNTETDLNVLDDNHTATKDIENKEEQTIPSKNVDNIKVLRPINSCKSPPYYPSDKEGFGNVYESEEISKRELPMHETFDDFNVDNRKLDDIKSCFSEETVIEKNDVDNCDNTEVPKIRCVNIKDLLSSDINIDSLSKEISTSPVKKVKNVSFSETPMRKHKSKTNDSFYTSSPIVKTPISILLNNKEKYANCWRSTTVELSDSDSDVTNTTKELMHNIKEKILEGKSDAFVSLSKDVFHSSQYTATLPSHGVKKMYNEHGKLSYSKKQMKLNEDAKKSVLTSSSSDEGLFDNVRKKQISKITKSSNSDSDSESSDFFKSTASRSQRKKFTKKRIRMEDSDSDMELERIVKFPRTKKRCKYADSSDEEMGRSARLKQREAPTAFAQAARDRNESDSSSSSTSKKASPDNSNKTEDGNVLFKTLINGDSKADTDLSSSDSTSDVQNKQESKTEKPLVDKIKNSLLEDETSSSGQEAGNVKVNGKSKGSKSEEEIKKVLIEDSDEELSKDIETIDSDIEDDIKTKRPASTINLDTDSSEDSVKVTKSKIKKVSQNGTKDSDESDEVQKIENSGSDSNSSEVFKPSKRKRKPKRKASSDSDEDNSQESSDSKERKKKRKRIKKISGDESSGKEESCSDEEEGNKKGRKNIRAMKKTSDLDSATREAAKKERERLARIAERQKLYNESMYDESGGPQEISKLDKVVLDFDPKTKEPLITVDKGLVEKLKPHQANGIKFMWDACFESVKQIKIGKGSGCILAHCMGLGKTLQVVTLVHTLLVHQDKTKVERVLVVCPLSTVLNWVNEFRMWLEHCEKDEDINIYELSRYKQNHERASQLKEWLECGGVCILGYDMFRNLSADNPKKFRKAQLTAFQKALVDPGPDLVVCDEGHLLKNEKTSLSQSMNKVKTLRRIVLTGTPLQNNLKEYYCMVQFVKPNLLGKYNEYLNRFVNPITNGQYTNSTDHDIKVMKRRSHVLHKMLDGAVQRRDYAVLAPFLPPKNEYVLFLTLTEIQIKLYKYYLENHSRRPDPERRTTPSLFTDFQSLQRIWTHPLVLKANSERYELMQRRKKDKEEEEEDESEGSLADFIDDEDETSTPEETSMSETEESDESDKPRRKGKKNKHTKTKHKRVTRSNTATTVKDVDDDDDVQEVKIEETKLENPTEWWMSLCSDDELNDIRHSNKLLLLLDILKECEAIGDKLLVFSQSLYSLDLIEQFLGKIDEATQKGTTDETLGGHTGSWSLGLDYFRLDGSSSCENRAIWCKSFNREDNPRARLFLISTRAGGLGINLVAANRVVIFDISWNPSHDVQSIFRVYRFGQKKPCYIYRFLAVGTMEEKIYERQVTKQAISKRVIDEQQIDRHYTESDLAELYKFCPEPEGPREVPILPKDRLFAELLKHHDTVIYKYHEHDSLLENKEEETLTEEERKAAWEDYENEKNRPPPTIGGTNWLLLQQQQQQQQMTINALQSVLRQDYPSLTEQQITAMIPAIMQQMHANGDTALTQKLTAMMAAQNNMMGGQMPGYNKYNPNLMSQGLMMTPGGMGMGGIRNPVYQQVWQQQQQQLQLQRLQQQQAMQTNLKYYAGGLGSRDLMDMAMLQQQQRALLLGNAMQSNNRGRPPKTALRPPRPINSNEIVDLDSE